MRDAPRAARSRPLWVATCLTATVLLASLGLSFTGDSANVDLTVFAGAIVLALVCGIGLTIRVRTRRIGVGMLIGVALAFLAALLASFWWLAWLANELRDS